MSSQRDFLVARANEARAEAEAATLDNVRQRCLRSAAAWEAMAVRAQRMETQRSALAAAKAAAALVAEDAD
jgi:hypothetical protein